MSDVQLRLFSVIVVDFVTGQRNVDKLERA